MTDGQKFGFYLPVWRRVVDAREWFRSSSPKSKVQGPKLSEVLQRQEEEFRSWPEPAGPMALQVLTVARQTALARAGAPAATREGACAPQVTAEDLRRACTFVATADLASRSASRATASRATATASSKHLNNTQVNHLVTLLKLLIEPDDLKAVTDWLHPENAQRNGLVDYIAKLAPEGLLRTIYRNAYDSSEWREGNKQRLVWLLKQVKGRTKEFRKPLTPTLSPSDGAREMDLEAEPF